LVLCNRFSLKTIRPGRYGSSDFLTYRETHAGEALYECTVPSTVLTSVLLEMESSITNLKLNPFPSNLWALVPHVTFCIGQGNTNSHKFLRFDLKEHQSGFFMALLFQCLKTSKESSGFEVRSQWTADKEWMVWTQFALFRLPSSRALAFFSFTDYLKSYVISGEICIVIMHGGLSNKKIKFLYCSAYLNQYTFIYLLIYQYRLAVLSKFQEILSSKSNVLLYSSLLWEYSVQWITNTINLFGKKSIERYGIFYSMILIFLVRNVKKDIQLLCHCIVSFHTESLAWIERSYLHKTNCYGTTCWVGFSQYRKERAIGVVSLKSKLVKSRNIGKSCSKSFLRKKVRTDGGVIKSLILDLNSYCIPFGIIVLLIEEYLGYFYSQIPLSSFCKLVDGRMEITSTQLFLSNVSFWIACYVLAFFVVFRVTGLIVFNNAYPILSFIPVFVALRSTLSNSSVSSFAIATFGIPNDSFFYSSKVNYCRFSK